GGPCTGPLVQGCGADDFATALTNAAMDEPGALMWDVAVALKDRLIAEPEIHSDAEVAVIEDIMDVSLDDAVDDLGAAATLAAARRYAGVLLNTPQFMLDGVVSAPQDPASDPVIVVPGTSSNELCTYFVGLAGQTASFGGLNVSCSGDGIVVQ